MRLLFLILAQGLLLSACSGSGPIYPVRDALYDWVMAPETVDPAADRLPVIADPIVHFRVAPGERRSTLRTGDRWRVGQTYLFGFDLRLERDLPARQRITVSRLMRQGDPAAEILSVDLDAAQGVTVMGRTCVAPADLTRWHRVEIRMKLADNDTGYIEVFCNRKPIWARVAMRTTFPPECRRSDGCDMPLPQPVRYEWKMGVMSETAAQRPVHLQMQRLHYRLLIYKPNRVGTL